MPLQLGVVVYRIASTLAVILILRGLFAFTYQNVNDAVLGGLLPSALVALLVWGFGRSAYQFLSRM